MLVTCALEGVARRVPESVVPKVIAFGSKVGRLARTHTSPLFGSIAGAESLLVAFAEDDPAKVTAVMSEAAHGTAPALRGKNVANPLAMILAGAALLSHTGLGASPAEPSAPGGKTGTHVAPRGDEGQRGGRAIREACLEAIAQGARTADLGGDLSTTEFTDEVIARVRSKLDVWASI